jgi:hypothetical protein
VPNPVWLTRDRKRCERVISTIESALSRDLRRVRKRSTHGRNSTSKSGLRGWRRMLIGERDCVRIEQCVGLVRVVAASRAANPPSMTKCATWIPWRQFTRKALAESAQRELAHCK